MRDEVYVGVDVGGTRKGFHAIALQERAIMARLHTLAASEMGDWCNELGVLGIAIDAPCRWSRTGRARLAEREMAKEKIFAFATPSRAEAETKQFYRWMLNGASLYSCIESNYKLFDGHKPRKRFCVETFPQAVACALAGRVLPAKKKSANRLAVLESEGIATTTLTNMDYIDAALCALAARYIGMGSYRSYGDDEEGFIVVPSISVKWAEDPFLGQRT